MPRKGDPERQQADWLLLGTQQGGKGGLTINVPRGNWGYGGILNLDFSTYYTHVCAHKMGRFHRA
jgi:hypothetical protein